MSARLAPAEEHRYVAARFAELVDSAPAGAWDDPAPVEGWTARDVVRHLIDWLPGFLASRSEVTLPEVPSVDEDPGGAWRARAADVQAVLEKQGDALFTSPQMGEMPVAQAIDRFYTADVFMHTWDLARALGVEPALDEARCEELLEGMQPYDELLRSSGQYGARVDVPADASAQDRLIGFIGRDPSWRRR